VGLADRHTLQQYDVDADVLSRWRETISPYLRARAALLREIERQGFRAPARPQPAAGGYVDIVFTGPPGPEPPGFVEAEDEHGRSIRYGEWIERGDGYWILRIPSVDSPGPGP
jgi:hypothetical protein